MATDIIFQAKVSSFVYKILHRPLHIVNRNFQRFYCSFILLEKFCQYCFTFEKELFVLHNLDIF